MFTIETPEDLTAEFDCSNLFEIEFKELTPAEDKTIKEVMARLSVAYKQCCVQINENPNNLTSVDIERCEKLRADINRAVETLDLRMTFAAMASVDAKKGQ